MEMLGMGFFNYNDQKNEECKHFDLKRSFYFACMFVLCLAMNFVGVTFFNKILRRAES
jgi:hypothetical protein